VNAFSAKRVRQEKVTEDALRYVVQHMRQRDRDEIYATHFTDDPELLVQGQLPWMGDMCCIWTRDGVPVSCQGVLPLWPGVWSMFAYGTDQWPHVVLSMTKHSLRFIVPALLAVNAHRVECRALASHTESRRWIEFLGAREEAVLRGFGKRREDFVLYVWRPEYVHRRRRWGRHLILSADAATAPDAAAATSIGGGVAGATARV
jgi:hypothetical protein